jgi:hypothetical protein
MESITLRGARATPHPQRICLSEFQPLQCGPVGGEMAATEGRAMTELAPQKDPAPKRDKDRMAAEGVVTANGLATHLGMTRQNVARLTAEAVIEQRSDGCYDQTASRLRYIKHLRSEQKRSPRSEADAAFQRAKAELMKLRIAEKRGQLMLVSEHNALLDEIAGLVLSRLSGFAARCGGRDLAVRREIDRAVFDLRKEISLAASAMADERGEPPEP